MVKVMAYFADIVKNHRCFIVRAAGIPLRKRRGLRVAVSCKVYPCAAHPLLQPIRFSLNIADRNPIGIMEYKRDFRAVPCRFSAVDRKFIGQLIRIHRCGKLCFFPKQRNRRRTEHGIHRQTAMPTSTNSQFPQWRIACATIWTSTRPLKVS